LIAVLVATIILMAALLPLLGLQGRLFETVVRNNNGELLQKINEDMARIEIADRMRPRQFTLADKRIERTVKRQGTNLYRIDYLIRNKEDNRLLFTVTRYYCRFDF